MPHWRRTTWALIVATVVWSLVFYAWFLAPNEPVDESNYLGRGLAALGLMIIWTLGAGATLVVLLVLRNLSRRGR